jgi:hypothetical protein
LPVLHFGITEPGSRVGNTVTNVIQLQTTNNICFNDFFVTYTFDGPSRAISYPTYPIYKYDPSQRINQHGLSQPTCLPRGKLGAQFILFPGADQHITQKRGISKTHIDRIHVTIGYHPMFSLHFFPVDRQCQVFGHYAINVDYLDARSFKIKTEVAQCIIGV